MVFTASPVIAAFVRALAALPERTVRLNHDTLGAAPHLGREQERDFILADTAGRVLAPDALDTLGLADHAAMLRGLPSMTDASRAAQAYSLANAAADAAGDLTAAATADGSVPTDPYNRIRAGAAAVGAAA